MKTTTDLVRAVVWEIEQLAGASSTNHVTVLNIAALLILKARAECEEACFLRSLYNTLGPPTLQTLEKRIQSLKTKNAALEAQLAALKAEEEVPF